MDLGLKSKNAIIFGASSGLGKATANSLAAEGCNITLIARDLSKLKILHDEILQEQNLSSDYFAVDLTEDRDVVSLLEDLSNRK